MTESKRRFERKRMLVTGASSGIGRATALALGREGAQVTIAGRRAEQLEAVARAVRAAGGEAVVATGDVREESVTRAWAKSAAGAEGVLDGLVNAAGVIGNGGVMDTEPAEWDRIMDSNLRSLYLMTRAAGEALTAGKGAIVNISSVAGLRPYASIGPYCVSKAAVDMLTQCAALEFAPHGVRVNAVNPGVVETELHTVSKAVADYPAFLARAKETHPLGRHAQPEEIASLVLYLLSADASWITGACYSIDGGRALASAR